MYRCSCDIQMGWVSCDSEFFFYPADGALSLICTEEVEVPMANGTNTTKIIDTVKNQLRGCIRYA